ncbi:GHKL domain-containing protein [Streptococcus rifensis]
MSLLHPFLVIFVDWLVKIITFKNVSNLKLSLTKTIGLVLVVTGLHLLHIEGARLIAPLILPLVAAIVFRPRWSLSQYLFYGLLPFVLVDIFQRLTHIDESLYLILIARESYWPVTLISLIFIAFFLPVGWLFSKVLRLNFITLSSIFQHQIGQKASLLINGALLVYVLVVYPILALSGEVQDFIFTFQTENTTSSLDLFKVYLYLFFTVLLYLNYKAKEYQDLELQRSKDQQVAALANYSQHVESLYRDLRSFRHDYTNVLTSLNEAFNKEDLAGAKQVYETVLARSDRAFYSSKFDIANLANLTNTALKSIFSAKLMEAESKGVALTVEIPEPIGEPDIELLDLVTILSIFLDNAIEAAEQSEDPFLSVAYFQEGQKTLLILENSCQEERVNVKSIYAYGQSSKGQERGIGLANVKSLLAKYPEASLETQSYNHRFKQTLML